jgi:hypothetical protein
MTLSADLAAFARYTVGLPRFLAHTVGPDEVRRRLRWRLEAREENLIALLERAVYARPSSPYRALLEHAGAELGDVADLVREEGVEGALERLHGIGVYVSLEEFRGRRPIKRGRLELATRPEDFDNPLVSRVSTTRTGGSRSPGRRVGIDFAHRELGVEHYSLVLQTFDLAQRPAGIWRAAPPGAAGLAAVIGAAKAGAPMQRWFSPSRLSDRPRELLLTAYSVFGGRLARRRLPWPAHVPVDRAETVARWLAKQKSNGAPALLSTTSSSGVRACLAAREHGLDISDTFFRFGGEPYTAGKARVVEEAGCRAVSNYSMTEVGRIGNACAAPTALDDLHLLIDHLGVIRRERTLAGRSIGVLTFTSLLPSAPKLMLNVESDDYGVVERRSCGCLLGGLGLDLHVHGVRSYEKLTSEGMTFVGSDLIELVDELLPRRFGGDATDYQLVEEEVDGLPEVRIVVSPRVGEIAEGEVVTLVLEKLGEGSGYKRMMADVWRTGGMLRVVRHEPYTTGSAKILPLHVVGG